MLELVLEYGNKILAQLGKKEIEKRQKGNFPSVQQIKQIVAVWSVRGASSTDVPCSFRTPSVPSPCLPLQMFLPTVWFNPLIISNSRRLGGVVEAGNTVQLLTVLARSHPLRRHRLQSTDTKHRFKKTCLSVFFDSVILGRLSVQFKLLSLRCKNEDYSGSEACIGVFKPQSDWLLGGNATHI